MDAPDVILNQYPNYISPLKQSVQDILDSRKNPLWQVAERRLFIVVSGALVLGRIAFVDHPLSRDDHGRASYFGYFDFVNDIDVASLLFEKVNELAKEKKSTRLIGPLNPTLNYELGVLVEGFDLAPYFMMNYNPPYYVDIYKSIGAKSCMDFIAYRFIQGVNTTKIDKVAQLIRTRYNVQIEDINFKKFNSEANLLCEIYNDAFEDHFGFVPFTREEFAFLARQLRQVMNKKLIFKVKVGEEVAGFMLTIPNINPAVRLLKNGKINFWNFIKFLFKLRKIDSTKVMLVAIKKKFKHMGLGSILYHEMQKRTVSQGFHEGEISWVADENKSMQKVIHSIGAVPYKKYALFERAVR